MDNTHFSILNSPLFGIKKGMLFLILLSSVFFFSCVTEDELGELGYIPVTVVTTDVSSITINSAVTGGTLTSKQARNIIARGVCWATTPNPTLTGNKNVESKGLGKFSSTITGLLPGTVYYVRAYAVNNLETAYGNEISFRTVAIIAPVVTTTAITAISQTSATSGGVVTNFGNGTITAQGVCWSTTENPTIAGSKTTDSIKYTTYASAIKGLAPNTKYYVRAYATNSAATGYGSQLSFTTSALGVPTLTTTAISAITTSSATSGGNVTSDGGATVTIRGVCWSTSPTPVITNSMANNGAGTGVFVSPLTLLAPNTKYYVRAFATNSIGTAYGNEVSFTTVPLTAPILSTTALTSITTTTATGGGNITSDGGTTITVRGVCWSTNTSPTIGDSKTTDGSGTGIFTSALTALTPSTKYYVRAYATNSVGTSYGDEVSFTTATPITAPVLSTSTVFLITINSANSGGNITSDGGATVTARGVCWSTNTSPTITDSKTTDGSGSGAFASALTGLNSSTTYYVRAYATNNIGTSYGNELSFTTAVNTNLLTNPGFETWSAGVPTGWTLTTTSGGTVTQSTITPTGTGNSFQILNPATTYSISQLVVPPAGAATFDTNKTYKISLKYLVKAGDGTDARVWCSFVSSVVGVTPLVYSSVPTTHTDSVILFNSLHGPGGSINPAVGVLGNDYNGYLLDNRTSGVWHTYSCLFKFPSGIPQFSFMVRAYYGSSVIWDDLYFGEYDGVSPTPAFMGTSPVSAITSNTATSGGYFITDGGATVTSRGVCWSTSTVPTIANSKTDDGTGTDTFISSITGLTASTTYHVRAYASNSVGTCYGDDQVLITKAAIAPVLTTSTISSITTTTAGSGGNISSDGGATITARGVCWSTTAGPTIANSKTTDGTGAGTFTSAITGLNPTTYYYVRAYATNSAGTSYGAEVTFTSATPVTIPTVTTTTISTITTSSASTGGNVTADGAGTITARGVCWSTSSGPTLANSFTTDGTGTGAFSSSITGLAEGTTYYVRAYATNSAGTGYGAELSFTSNRPTVADIDGNVYHTVTIGTQTWMVENLKTTSYRDGTPIPNVTDNTAWSILTTGAYCDYNNTPSNSNTYGKLYNWYAATDVRNIAPEGWHVPTDAEWTTLTTYLGGESVAGGKLKETGTIHWSDPNTGATNETGFSALPGGSRNVSIGTFSNLGGSGYWWTAAEYSTNNARHRDMYNSISDVVQGSNYKTNGMSVRCIKGEVLSQPTLTTTAASTITSTNATAGGNVSNDGGANVTARGVCWSTSSSPTTANSFTTNGSGTGSFSSSITGLTPSRTYYVRAYATNSVGTSYGNEISFTTTASATLPTLSTTTISDITAITATSGGNITSDGGATITARGVCWSTSSGPTTANSYTTDGSGTGSFTSSLTNLSPITTYYVRAYATNSVGTSYGSEVTFTTATPITAPVLSTTAISAITTTTASCGGNVSSDGGAIVTSRGVCWSTSTNPTITNSKTSEGTGTGTYTSAITGLNSSTTYYVRAYATNSAGTSYGNEVSFITNTKLSSWNLMGDFSTTNNPNGDWSYGRKWSAATDNFDIFTVPSWWFGNTGHGAPNVQPNSMWAKDNSNGLPCVRWTCPEAGNFSLTTTFTGGDSRGVDVIVYVTKNSIILFTDIIQANNAKVSYYFNDLSFAKSDHLDFLIKWNGGVDSEYSWTNVKAVITTTPQVTIPTLTTTSASSITTTTTSGGGNVTSDGGATITVRGVCWSTSSSPTTANNKTSNGTGTGAFSSSLTGLNPSTTYYIRAYATNSVGTSYGNEVSFTTAAPATLPVLTTTSASTITSTTASSGGNVSSDGGATITARGVCWSTNASANPTISDNKTTDGTGTGIFTSSLTGLNPSTTYYVRAYATNSVGTSYGNEISFTTTSPATVPVLTTTSVASITSTTAGSGGNITSDGGATVTVRGVCWSTTANPTTANNTTSDGSGTGTFTSSITGLAEGTTYYVRAYATNSAGTGYGTEVSFKTTSPTVADIDGNVYHTVTIGTQTWMVENLKTTSYRDGTPIPCITDGSNWSAGTAWSTLTTGAYCDYNNTPSNSSTYGKLYNWYAATDVRNIAPTGWHVPTDAEWTTLTDYLGGLDVAGGKLKETGTLHWSDPNTGATNETGFTALPGGNCLSNGVFSSVGNSGNWWSTIENGASNAWFRFQSNIHSNIVRLNYAKTYGFSVRCIKDN